jgi:hypothetical protein
MKSSGSLRRRRPALEEDRGPDRSEQPDGAAQHGILGALDVDLDQIGHRPLLGDVGVERHLGHRPPIDRATAPTLPHLRQRAAEPRGVTGSGEVHRAAELADRQGLDAWRAPVGPAAFREEGVTSRVRLERDHPDAVREQAQRVQAVARADVEEHSGWPLPADERCVQVVHLGIVPVEAQRGGPREREVAGQRQNHPTAREVDRPVPFHRPPLVGAQVEQTTPHAAWETAVDEVRHPEAGSRRHRLPQEGSQEGSALRFHAPPTSQTPYPWPARRKAATHHSRPVIGWPTGCSFPAIGGRFSPKR